MNPKKKPQSVKNGVFRIVASNKAHYEQLLDKTAELACISLILEDVSLFNTSELTAADFSDANLAVIFGCIGNLLKDGITDITQQQILDEVHSLNLSSIETSDVADLLIKMKAMDVVVTNFHTYTKRVKKSAYLIRLSDNATNLTNSPRS